MRNSGLLSGDNMNNEALCDVMLKSYKYLETKCKMIEYQAWKCALNSQNSDAYQCAETLIKLNREKLTYCNVKVIIDEALNKIGRNTELKDYYIYGVYYKNTMIRENISRRTYYYRLDKQKQLLFNAIKEKYDDDVLLETLCGSRWLFNMYNKAVKRATKSDKEKRKEMNDQKPETA